MYALARSRGQLTPNIYFPEAACYTSGPTGTCVEVRHR